MGGAKGIKGSKRMRREGSQKSTHDDEDEVAQAGVDQVRRAIPDAVMRHCRCAVAHIHC